MPQGADGQEISTQWTAVHLEIWGKRRSGSSAAQCSALLCLGGHDTTHHDTTRRTCFFCMICSSTAASWFESPEASMVEGIWMNEGWDGMEDSGSGRIRMDG